MYTGVTSESSMNEQVEYPDVNVLMDNPDVNAIENNPGLSYSL